MGSFKEHNMNPLKSMYLGMEAIGKGPLHKFKIDCIFMSELVNQIFNQQIGVGFGSSLAAVA